MKGLSENLQCKHANWLEDSLNFFDIKTLLDPLKLFLVANAWYIGSANLFAENLNC